MTDPDPKALRELAEELRKRRHYDPDDGFYACPRADGYFGSYSESDTPVDKRPCYCGLDDAKAAAHAILALLARVEELEKDRARMAESYLARVEELENACLPLARYFRSIDTHPTDPVTWAEISDDMIRPICRALAAGGK